VPYERCSIEEQSIILWMGVMCLDTHIFTVDFNFLKGSLREVFISRSALKG
jgi:hypothetical protein